MNFSDPNNFQAVGQGQNSETEDVDIRIVLSENFAPTANWK